MIFHFDVVVVLERGSEFLAGYQRAGAEAVRFVELQGSRDGLADQLAAHLHSHADMMAKGTGCDHYNRLIQPLRLKIVFCLIRLVISIGCC